MPPPRIIFSILFLFFITTFTSSSTLNTNTITLPLSPLHTNTHPSSSHPFHKLQLAVSTSITRARHLKNHKPNNNINNNNNPSLLKTQVHPKSYGGYSIDLQFGTPPQTFPFVLDTGSTLTWLPCSSHYLCSKCNSFPNNTPKFIPRNSTSSKFVGCNNPKCAWVFGTNVQSRCCKQNTTSNTTNTNNNKCSQICPAYSVQYGLGSTAGFLLSENLNFPKQVVPSFLVGCSLVSVYQPGGIAGFGRGPESIPSQMNLTKFSYCLVSHQFDNSLTSSNLILETSSRNRRTGELKTNGVSYTPFRKNPFTKNPAFGTYYYVTLRRIIVGEKRVKVPKRLLEPNGDSNGGSILDSGSTFTFMERPIFNLVAQEFSRQVNYTRAREVERELGLSPCFVVGGETASFPGLRFEFKGGAKMKLPVANYFSLVEKSNVACLTIVSDDVVGGPAVILGNYQQQNFYVEYDLENERFGFRSQSCETSV